MPVVSVVIPTYNCARYLVEAVDSVLKQTFRDLEVLVIDDGSADETERVMQKYVGAVRYIRQDNQGVSAARNRGVRESTGKYVAFLDADDTWFPNKLDRQVQAMGSRPDCGVCYSDFSVVSSDLSPLDVPGIKPGNSPLDDLLTRGNVIGSVCTVVCQRSLLEEVGGFDTSLSQCADWDLWVRLAARTDFLFLDEPLATYRQHSANMSNNVQLLEHDSLLLLEKGFAMEGLPVGVASGRRQAFARNYMVLSGSYFVTKRYLDAMRCAVRAVRLDVRQFGYLAGFPLRRLSRPRTHRHPVRTQA